MQIANHSSRNYSSQHLFDQYPWAANHVDAISYIARYMGDDAEIIIQHLDERILNKVASSHL